MSRYAKTPTVFQMEATECGAASLSMIFGYFGKHLPLEQMRIETGVSRDGCNAANIMRCAKKYGLECHGYRKEPEELRKIKPPCIIHWNFNHFVVFEGFKLGHAYINDPAYGRRKLTYQELDESFTGVILTFKRTKDFKKEKARKTTAAFLMRRMKGQWGVLFKLFFIGLLMVAPATVLPVLSQVYIDDVLIGGYTDWVTKILILMGGCLLLKCGLDLYQNLILQKLKSKMTIISGHKFLLHMFRLPISFFDQRYAGDLVNRTDNNEQVNDFAAGQLTDTLLDFITAAFYLAILIVYSPVMTGIGCANIALCVIVTLVANKRLMNANIRMQMDAGKLSGAVCAGINITDTIKASGIEEQYANRLIGYQAKQSNQEQKMNRFQQIVSSISGASGQITDVLILLVGGLMVMQGHLTIGMLVAFNSIFDSFSAPINDLIGFFGKIQVLKSNIHRVEDIEKYPQEDMASDGADKADIRQKLNGDMELRDVAFGYSRLKPPLIEHFSVKARSGDSIAFVGPSGCGKSTVSKVISGLYNVWEGQLLLDGIPAKRVPHEVMTSSIATVSQNIMLFTGTIRDNLTLWSPAVLEQDMIQAAKDACIHDFIMTCPGGYDHVLEENGANLSGGQRQRMEIARALALKPTILIMDEATSALDPLVEKQVLDNIRRRGVTSVIVAHRLSAFRDCNEIIVMSKGKIVQRGTHASLMNEEGLYRNIVTNA